MLLHRKLRHSFNSIAMRRLKKKSGLYNYLASCGVLEHGTEEEITNRRKEYRKEYKKRWRKKYRKERKEYTPAFSLTEVKLIREEARRHRMSPTKYIRTSALAYIDRVYIIPNDMEVRRIAQILAMMYNLFLEMKEDKTISGTIGNNVLDKHSILERQVLLHLKNPLTLEEWIRREIAVKPLLKEKILSIIQE